MAPPAGQEGQDPDESSSVATDPEILAKLSAEQRERLVSVVTEVAGTFEGPLPPPRVLAEYDRQIWGGAERLMKLLEEQTRHCQEVERQMVQAETQVAASRPLAGVRPVPVLRRHRDVRTGRQQPGAIGYAPSGKEARHGYGQR